MQALNWKLKDEILGMGSGVPFSTSVAASKKKLQ
jgi:hypothetical protein